MKTKMWKKIVALSLILVVVLTFAACGEAELPSAQEIADSVIESFDNIRTYQLDMDVTFDMTIEQEGEVSEFTQALGYIGTVDVVNRQMGLKMTYRAIAETQPEMENVTEVYLIGNIQYQGQQTEDGTKWKKYEKQAGSFEEWQKMGWGESQIELLEAAHVEVLGSERVDGIDCYVLEVTPDLEQLWQLSNQLHFDEAPDVTEEYLQEIFRSFSVKQWVAKDTYFLTKAEIDIAEEFPPEEAGPLTLDIAVVLLSYNYNQPVSIELPPEAEEATQ